MAKATSATTNFTGEAATLASAVEVIASFVAHFEPAQYSVSDAASLVTLLERGKRLCAAGETLSASRAAEGNAHHLSGHRTPDEWLSAITGSSRGEAVGILKVGEALCSQPEVEEALRGGKLTSSQATLVTDAVKVNPNCGQDLVKRAEQDSLSQLKERCLRAKAEGRSADDAARHRKALHDNRRCRTFTDAEGAFRLEAHLTPEAGATVLAALDSRADRYFKEARRSGTFEAVDAYRADALCALVTGTATPGTATPGTATPGQGSAEPSGDSRAAAELSTRAAATDPPTGCGTATLNISMLIRVDLESLRRGSVGPGEVCEIPGVGPVSVQWAREQLGDALCDLVITDGVDVSTVVRLGRHIPAPLMTAILERDQRCVVPGCNRRLGLEFDHWQVAYADGGEMSYDNIARLCSHHHYQRTHQGFVLSRTAGKWCWDPPDHPPDRIRKKGPKRRKQGRADGRTHPRSDPPLFADDG
ncbi:MAG: HNH endonuclease signature motif containing protein [Acidimicrobiales bacterium]|jgi:hypothetical protein